MWGPVSPAHDTGPAPSSSTVIKWAKQGGRDTTQNGSFLKLCVTGDRRLLGSSLTYVWMCGVCVCVCERERERQLHSCKHILPFHYLVVSNCHQRVRIWSGRRTHREHDVSMHRGGETGRNQGNQATSSSKKMCHGKRGSCPKLE